MWLAVLAPHLIVRLDPGTPIDVEQGNYKKLQSLHKPGCNPCGIRFPSERQGPAAGVRAAHLNCEKQDCLGRDHLPRVRATDDQDCSFMTAAAPMNPQPIDGATLM